ncbi:hypothetical protein BPC006_II1186 [Burkholderia pseudomallei BPC006]|uniref:Uncharacterized protein n=1 Tax=Burkholderia pseudomallei 1710a TaxID=320371 RepID=A0A0E1VTH1_BURPE|nr:hypothetical protein BPC006_II1186 [Burkholderia pseudomallei BPC006]EET03296.1 hypothetical protein BURPS1710A_A0313 [Burkholderia pseudomallei 1710a]
MRRDRRSAKGARAAGDAIRKRIVRRIVSRSGRMKRFDSDA